MMDGMRRRMSLLPSSPPPVYSPAGSAPPILPSLPGMHDDGEFLNIPAFDPYATSMSDSVYSSHDALPPLAQPVTQPTRPTPTHRMSLNLYLPQKSKRKMSAGSPSSPSTPSGSKILGGLLRLDKDRSTTPPPPLRPRIKLDTPPEGALVIPPAVIPAGRPIVPTAAPGAVTNVTSIPIRLPSAATAPSAPSPQQERGRTGFVATVESRHESSPARAATPREYSASRRPMTEFGRGGEQVVDLTTPRASLETEATARECDSFVLVPSTAPRSKSPYLSPATAGEASSPTSSSGRDTSPLRLATPESPSGRTVNASAFKSVGRQEAAALVALAKEMPQPRVPVQQPTSPATQRIAQSATYGQVLSDEPMAAHTVVQQPTPPHEVPRTPKLTRMVTDEQLPAPPPFRAASPTVYEPKPGRLPAAARAPLLGMTGSAIDLQMNEDEQQPMEDVVGEPYLAILSKTGFALSRVRSSSLLRCFTVQSWRGVCEHGHHIAGRGPRGFFFADHFVPPSRLPHFSSRTSCLRVLDCGEGCRDRHQCCGSETRGDQHWHDPISRSAGMTCHS
ncbi:hypothetical protein BKA62DRAFT_446046 [Auriculariales sp. MPI-PUGE-AT-0066]|nr:hypothetical protein BKA62DRAFT_446046 [Auriculariales sp. MPI-PUGE-AT-0066]